MMEGERTAAKEVILKLAGIGIELQSLTALV
jgi:hypothetical protein